MITLYSATICPFAQRPRALLAHLGVPFDLREIDLDDRDPAFLALTPTGKVPLLVDADLRLYESQIINDYLAETQGWDGAYAADAGLRARQRLAMKMWDATVLPAFHASLREEGRAGEREREGLVRVIDDLAGTAGAMAGAVESLIAFHCAPFWARMTWLRDRSAVPSLLEASPVLRGWLDRAVALPAVAATLPDRDRAVARYLRRR